MNIYRTLNFDVRGLRCNVQKQKQKQIFLIRGLIGHKVKPSLLNSHILEIENFRGISIFHINEARIPLPASRAHSRSLIFPPSFLHPPNSNSP